MDDSTAFQSIVTKLPHAHTVPNVSIKQTNKQKYGVIGEQPHLCPQWLFCVPLAPQEDMAVELSQDQAAEEPLDTVNVRAPFLIWDKTVASLLYFLFSWKQL